MLLPLPQVVLQLRVSTGASIKAQKKPVKDGGGEAGKLNFGRRCQEFRATASHCIPHRYRSGTISNEV